MKARLLFLGGLPGAGKSTLSEALARNVLSVEAVNAGSLIPEARLSSGMSERQHTIIDAVDTLRQRLSARSLILDGHYTLQTEDDVSRVDPQLFVELGVDDYCILVTDPALIATRLRQRAPASTRWWDGTTDQLVAFQDLELEHARIVAGEAGKPLNVLTGDGYDHLLGLVVSGRDDGEGSR